jgi:hypothetical protein
VAQLLDDLIAAGEGGACRQLAEGCLEGFRHDRRMVPGRRELGAAISAELLGLRIFRITFRALVGQTRFPFLAWPQINRGTGGKSNVLDGLSTFRLG